MSEPLKRQDNPEAEYGYQKHQTSLDTQDAGKDELAPQPLQASAIPGCDLAFDVFGPAILSPTGEPVPSSKHCAP